MLGTYARAQWWVRARSWVGDRLERTDPLEASEAGCDGWWAAVGGEAAAGAVGGHPIRLDDKVIPRRPTFTRPRSPPSYGSAAIMARRPHPSLPVTSEPGGSTQPRIEIAPQSLWAKGEMTSSTH